ncbi:aldose 1-epimerase [Sphaerochaeta pleomorpha]|nr:aldose 1-epimerase [Sphaerochaeta pleomorpha]
MLELKCSKWSAKIDETFGADLVSLRYDGHRILLEPENRHALENSPFINGSPILFPPNRTEDGVFAFEGREYHLPVNEKRFNVNLHGVLYDVPFSVVEVTDRSARLAFENEGGPYPFDFRIERLFSLDENGLTDTILLKNTSDHPMPFALAFHTTFDNPDFFSVQLGRSYERNDRYLPTGRMMALTETEKSFAYGCNPKSLIISGAYESNGTECRIDDFLFSVSDNFSDWVLFNGDGFICIEPHSNTVNALNISPSVLKSQEITRFSMRFSNIVHR